MTRKCCREVDFHLTDLRPLAGCEGSNIRTKTSLNSSGLDKLISRINASRESVSLCQCPTLQGRGTQGIRNGLCQEIQLKSLILAQPERWRRG